MNRKPRLSRLRSQSREAKAPLSDHELANQAWTFLRHALDPIAFACEKLSFNPDEKQEAVLTSTSDRIILNWARQRGKSQIVALRAFHRACFFAGSMIIIISASEDQAVEVLKKVNQLREKCGLEGKPVTDNKMSLELANRSRILALPASAGTVRGYSAVDLLIEDEAGEVPDDLHETIKPMLQVSHGTMFLMGTPKGPKGHFARIWHEGGKEWFKSQSSAWDNPRVDRAALTREKRHCERHGKSLWFQQEYECAFIATGSGLVYPYATGRNDSPALPTNTGEWMFVLGIDYGFVDATAFTVVGWRKNDPVVYVVESHKQTKLTPGEAAEFALKLTKRYPMARIVGDAGGLGKGYIEEARKRFHLPIEPAKKENKRGYIDLMAGELRVGMIKVMPGNEGLVKEWSTIPWDEHHQMPSKDYEDHQADSALYAWKASYAYLEEARTAPPEPGTPEALAKEAEEMFERRMVEVQRTESPDWWDAPQERATDISSVWDAWGT